jgi:hypothetical protein
MTGYDNENNNNTINDLWDEIKISSITLLFMSAYMVSAVTVLLRVQLHILGNICVFIHVYMYIYL